MWPARSAVPCMCSPHRCKTSSWNGFSRPLTSNPAAKHAPAPEPATMRAMLRKAGFCVVFLCLSLMADEKYDGPKPDKPDVPYIVQAGTLIETELKQATESHQKKDTIYTVPGASSPAKTPLAEPKFVLQAKNITPQNLQ